MNHRVTVLLRRAVAGLRRRIVALCASSDGLRAYSPRGMNRGMDFFASVLVQTQDDLRLWFKGGHHLAVQTLYKAIKNYSFLRDDIALAISDVIVNREIQSKRNGFVYCLQQFTCESGEKDLECRSHSLVVSAAHEC